MENKSNRMQSIASGFATVLLPEGNTDSVDGREWLEGPDPEGRGNEAHLFPEGKQYKKHCDFKPPRERGEFIKVKGIAWREAFRYSVRYTLPPAGGVHTWPVPGTPSSCIYFLSWPQALRYFVDDAGKKAKVLDRQTQELGLRPFFEQIHVDRWLYMDRRRKNAWGSEQFASRESEFRDFIGRTAKRLAPRDEDLEKALIQEARIRLLSESSLDRKVIETEIQMVMESLLRAERHSKSRTRPLDDF